MSQSTTAAPSIPPPVKASPVTAVAPKTPAKVAPTPHLSDDQLVLNEMLRQQSAPASSTSPASTSAKDLPSPHLSDDQLVLNEMLRQQREKSDAIRKQRIDHINAEALRHDAITVTLKWVDKLPVFTLRNNTDIILSFNLEFEMSVGDGSFNWTPYPFMLTEFGTHEHMPVAIYRGEEVLIRDNKYKIRWSAHPWNFNHL